MLVPSQCFQVCIYVSFFCVDILYISLSLFHLPTIFNFGCFTHQQSSVWLFQGPTIFFLAVSLTNNLPFDYFTDKKNPLFTVSLTFNDLRFDYFTKQQPSFWQFPWPMIFLLAVSLINDPMLAASLPTIFCLAVSRTNDLLFGCFID